MTPPIEGFSSARKFRETRRSYGPEPKPNILPVPKHLQHLPLDRFGYPVPYVSDSTSTAGDDGTPYDGHWADLPGHPEWGQWQPNADNNWNVGKPLPAVLNPTRQIRCVNERLCGTCGRKISPRSKVVLIGSGYLINEGFREPGVHKACARYALRACPGINHGRVVVCESVSPRIEPRWHDAERIRDDGPNIVHSVLGPIRIPLFELWQFPLDGDYSWEAPDWLRDNHVEPHPMACPYPMPRPDKGSD